MISEGYSMDLYCDFDGPHGYGDDKGEVFGHTKAEAYREARAAGWAIRKVGGVQTAKCPKCVKVRAKMKPGGYMGGSE